MYNCATFLPKITTYKKICICITLYFRDDECVVSYSTVT